LRNQLVTVELSAVDSHLPIVESAAASAPASCTLHWRDESATQAFAQRLAGCPALRNAFIALHGDLGAGKTTFVRHLLQALGVQGRIKSPTYAVVEPYELPGLALWHFDFYRFADPQEWEEAGFRDLFASPGLKLAEWPEKVASMLPTADVDIRLTTLDDGTRSVTLTGNTSTGETLVRSVMPAGGTA
jgi:tRNA threonylcarbamoyladenosine biosynthesis protein TsaE